MNSLRHLLLLQLNLGGLGFWNFNSFGNFLQKIFSNIPGIKIYIDDLIIYTKTRTEHNKILKKVLDRPQ